MSDDRHNSKWPVRKVFVDGNTFLWFSIAGSWGGNHQLQRLVTVHRAPVRGLDQGEVEQDVNEVKRAYGASTASFELACNCAVSLR